MRRSGLNEPPRAVRWLTPILTASLLFIALDLHSLLHEAQGLPAVTAAHAEDHPEPAHLDHTAIDVPCFACLFGLKSQSRPAEAPGTIDRLAARGRLAVPGAPDGVADLSYRLPLSRAPPFS